MLSFFLRPWFRPSAAVFWGLGLSTSATALAEEPRHPSEPRLLDDTAVDLLDVPDAFDDGDDFDLNLRLSLESDARSAGLRRESPRARESAGTPLEVGTYKESTQRLVPELDIGILPELALRLRLPVILAHNRTLQQSGGADSSEATSGLPGESLFALPFAAPTRSGLEYLAVGLDWGVLSQFRNSRHPNWVIGVEGRFNVSEPMHACNKAPSAGTESCAFPADVDRDGTADTLGDAFGSRANEKEGDFSGGREAGVSRGTTALEAHVYVSRRIKYVEPYGGISALAEAPLGSSDFGTSEFMGVSSNHPPLRGSVILGLAIVPWEQVEKFQRISFDLRIRGTYVSQGRDYSELFDALGSSSAPSLRSAQYAEYSPQFGPNGAPDPNAPSVPDADSERVSFTGLTAVQQHGDYTFRAQFTWQAGQYVKFDLGGSLRVVEAHAITVHEACSSETEVDPAEAGPCNVQDGTTTDASGAEVPAWQATGLPNPHYRAVVDEPGRRFLVDTSLGFHGFVRANVLF